MTWIVDASALLAVLLDEAGADFVVSEIRRSLISTVNLSESMSRAIDRGHDAATVEGLIATFEVLSTPFLSQHARLAAELRPRTSSLGLSLGDRACLALAFERQLPILTGDRRLASFAWDIPIRLIR